MGCVSYTTVRTQSHTWCLSPCFAALHHNSDKTTLRESNCGHCKTVYPWSFVFDLPFIVVAPLLWSFSKEGHTRGLAVCVTLWNFCKSETHLKPAFRALMSLGSKSQAADSYFCREGGILHILFSAHAVVLCCGHVWGACCRHAIWNIRSIRVFGS